MHLTPAVDLDRPSVPVSEGAGGWQTMNGSAWAKLYNRRTQRASEKDKQVYDGMWHWHSMFRKGIHHSNQTATRHNENLQFVHITKFLLSG